MIIVKTKNGGRFINDKAVTMVEHDRENAVVNAYGDKGAYHHIEDVEGIIYTNDTQPTSRRRSLCATSISIAQASCAN